MSILYSKNSLFSMQLIFNDLNSESPSWIGYDIILKNTTDSFALLNSCGAPLCFECKYMP